MADSESMEVRVRRKVASDLYRKLYTDSSNEEQPREEPVSKGKKKSLWEKITFGNILWVISAAAVLYTTDIVFIALFDDRVKRLWFFCGVSAIFINISIATFLIVYLSLIKKIDSDGWDYRYPAAIPIATASFLIGSFCLLVALWPVYGYFTAPLLFTVFMGFVILISWLPSF